MEAEEPPAAGLGTESDMVLVFARAVLLGRSTWQGAPPPGAEKEKNFLLFLGPAQLLTRMDGLYLPSQSQPQVHVHPLVIFSLLNHHARREAGNRVIGALLGSVDKSSGVVEVTDAFGVYHKLIEEVEVRGHGACIGGAPCARRPLPPPHPSLPLAPHLPPPPLHHFRCAPRSLCASRRCRSCTSCTAR